MVFSRIFLRLMVLDISSGTSASADSLGSAVHFEEREEHCRGSGGCGIRTSNSEINSGRVSPPLLPVGETLDFFLVFSAAVERFLSAGITASSKSKSSSVPSSPILAVISWGSREMIPLKS